MKKFLVFLCLMFVGGVGATTVNLNWTVDGNSYAQTTCETGGNLTLPAQAPTKYGYTFQGWYMNDTVIYGTGSQTGTPTPTNPIEPVWYQNGNLVLRALNNNIKDSYSTTTGKITRRVGVRVLDGTENWGVFDNSSRFLLANEFDNMVNSKLGSQTNSLCSHFQANSGSTTDNVLGFGFYKNTINEDPQLRMTYPPIDSVPAFKQFLADQYANGTPVTVYYPLAEPVEEYYDGQLN